MTDKRLPNRLKIKQLIETKAVTSKDICEILNISKSLRGQYFTQLRLSGHFPLVNESGFLELVDKDTWEAHKRAREKKAVSNRANARTTEEQLSFLRKRFDKCKVKYAKAAKRWKEKPHDNLLLNKYNLALAEYNIASINLNTYCDKHDIYNEKIVDIGSTE